MPTTWHENSYSNSLFALWTQPGVQTFSHDRRAKSLWAMGKCQHASALEEGRSGKWTGSGLVESLLRALICLQEGFPWHRTYLTARYNWMSPFFQPNGKEKDYAYKWEQRSCHRFLLHINKGGRKVWFYLKSIYHLRNSLYWTFQGLQNDKAPVGLLQINDGVMKNPLQLHWVHRQLNCKRYLVETELAQQDKRTCAALLYMENRTNECWNPKPTHLSVFCLSNSDKNKLPTTPLNTLPSESKQKKQ